MKNPLVSILIPAYNVEKYISESIESILIQTFKDFEIIIMDDNSTDSTWEIIKSYSNKDPRIIIFKNDNNQGIAGNRNKLIEKAKGKYIAWQDSDDISLPNRINDQFIFMEKNTEVGICGGYLEFFSENKSMSIRKYASSDAELRKNIFKFSPVAQPAAMVRKEVFNKVGNFNLKYPPAEDLDMSFRIGTFYKFANLQSIILKYRSHNDSATFKKLRKIEVSTLKIRWNNLKNHAYSVNPSDFIYNGLQFLSMIIPSKIKISIFNLFRNTSI